MRGQASCIVNGGYYLRVVSVLPGALLALRPLGHQDSLAREKLGFAATLAHEENRVRRHRSATSQLALGTFVPSQYRALWT